MSHYRVLLVEPNTELARIVEGYFVRSELEVLNAVDAANALEVARRERPDIVVCEADLPGDAGGLELVRAL